MEAARAWTRDAAKRFTAFLSERPGAALALAGLVLLTLLAALSGAPSPLDARSGKPVEGFLLQFPGRGAWLEPFFALGHALAGAPDYRVAAASTLLWLLTGAGLWAAVRRMRAEEGPARRAALSGLAGAGAAAGLFGSYMLLCLLVRPPGWRLVPLTPDFLVADLQTHTFASHDGLVSVQDNLRWHADAGYDVVAVTEHDGAWEASELEETAAEAVEPEERQLAVIPGAEVRESGGGYLLGLGIGLTESDIDILGLRDAAKFSAYVRAGTEEHPDGGALLALYWKLGKGDVDRLARAGVDGFEIANFGHPAFPDEVRAELLGPRLAGLSLVSDSDWHGFGGFARTWTAIRSPGARMLSHEDRAEIALDALRMRRSSDIIPLTAGRMGRPSALRAVFAPWAEGLRYCLELSGWRVLSWWAWALLLGGAVVLLERAGLRPGRVLAACLSLAMGCGLLASAARLLAAWGSGQTAGSYAAKVGGWAAILGLALSIFAAASLYAEARRHEAVREQEPRLQRP